MCKCSKDFQRQLKNNSLNQYWLLGAIVTCPHHRSLPVVLHRFPPPLGVVGSNSENSHFLAYSQPAPHAHGTGLLWRGSSNFGKEVKVLSGAAE